MSNPLNPSHDTLPIFLYDNKTSLDIRLPRVMSFHPCITFGETGRADTRTSLPLPLLSLPTIRIFLEDISLLLGPSFNVI